MQYLNLLKSNEKVPEFQLTHSFQQRKKEANNIKTKYPDRIPVICEVIESSKNQLTLDNKKYLIPCNITVGQFIFVIRKRVKINESQALYVFINNRMPAIADTMLNLYHSNKDKDDFLYVFIGAENTFG